MDAETAGARTRVRGSFQSQDIEAHPLRFTGSGGEYFRVWIVNVLLTIVTLGLYTPWARRRTAQYFYGHTLVAGSPLEFTAQQRRMVVGFAMVALLMLAYNLASYTGQDTAVNLFILGAAVLAPLVWGSAMRFRLANTRWRGLRLGFTAGWREVYAASWPVFALALVWIGTFYGLQALMPEMTAMPETAKGAGRWLRRVTFPMGALLALGLALSLLCVIRLEFNYRSLLVRRARIGSEPGRWKPVYMDFVRLWIGTVLVFIASVVAMTVAGTALLGGGTLVLAGLQKHLGPWVFVAVLLWLFLVFLLALLATAPARAWRQARLFQLTWDNIGVSRIARFKCGLRTGAYMALWLRNMVLTFVTLGLYRPFARVSEYRMKLESVTLHVRGGVDQVTGRLARRQPGGIGDALADAAGLDLIG